MSWQATLSGTTARGRAFSRAAEKTVTWTVGERCFGHSGSSEGHVRGRELKTELTNFRRCQGECPEAGGRIVITRATGARVEIEFDGSSVAKISGPRGDASLSLACAER
jgi:hypothetical protein